MQEISLFRLCTLRAIYAFIVAGLGIFLWPDIVSGAGHWELARGEANCMLGAFSVLCALGIRFPLQMLPVLLWEVLWKTLWLLLVPCRQWLAGGVDPAIGPTVFACGMVVLVYAAVPWPYVARRYLLSPGERWFPRRGAARPGYAA